jgi:hypothetical protein
VKPGDLFDNGEKCRRCSQTFKYGTLDNDMRCASCAQEYADEST